MLCLFAVSFGDLLRAPPRNKRWWWWVAFLRALTLRHCQVTKVTKKFKRAAPGTSLEMDVTRSIYS